MGGGTTREKGGNEQRENWRRKGMRAEKKEERQKYVQYDDQGERSVKRFVVIKLLRIINDQQVIKKL